MNRKVEKKINSMEMEWGRAMLAAGDSAAQFSIPVARRI